MPSHAHLCGAAFLFAFRPERSTRMKELEKIYDPSSVEDKHYKKWVDAGYFHAERDPDKRPYTIVMPPPNKMCIRDRS